MFKKLRAKRESGINKRVEKSLVDKVDRKFDLYKEIKKSPYMHVRDADIYARKFLENKIETKHGGNIVAGQMVMFDYFNPKTKEQLEYYDAMPCTIFFGFMKTKEGKRIIGFNLHYFPPKIRYKVIDKIFEMYRPVFARRYRQGFNKPFNQMDYDEMMKVMEKAKLDFGVRMYDPSLIASAREIPPKMWQVAIFTEGKFKKQTMAAIMRHWRNLR